MQGINSNLNQTTHIPSSNVNKSALLSGPIENGKPLPTSESETVHFSSQAKLALEEDNKSSKDKEETMGSTMQSFAHGALGMDHPDDLEEQKDESYSAGQYVSAAVTVGALLLAIV
ncbi:hypothetical protein ACE1OE_04380 [Vibrio sp. E150_011]